MHRCQDALTQEHWAPYAPAGGNLWDTGMENPNADEPSHLTNVSRPNAGEICTNAACSTEQSMRPTTGRDERMLRNQLTQATCSPRSLGTVGSLQHGMNCVSSYFNHHVLSAFGYFGTGHALFTCSSFENEKSAWWLTGPSESKCGPPGPQGKDQSIGLMACAQRPDTPGAQGTGTPLHCKALQGAPEARCTAKHHAKYLVPTNQPLQLPMCMQLPTPAA